MRVLTVTNRTRQMVMVLGDLTTRARIDGHQELPSGLQMEHPPTRQQQSNHPHRHTRRLRSLATQLIFHHEIEQALLPLTILNQILLLDRPAAAVDALLIYP